LAAQAFRRALALEPSHDGALSNLGALEVDIEEHSRAIVVLDRGRAVRPHHHVAAYNKAMAWQGLGQLDRAIAGYSDLVRRMPEFGEARWNLALARLLAGDYRRGWREHEWRWHHPKLTPRRFPGPLWDGRPIAGHRILVHAEQGLGDTLQFMRFLPMLAKKGCRIAFDCPIELIPLAETMAAVDTIVPTGAQCPDVDYHVPLMSLPFVLETTLESLPSAMPYVFANKARVKRWSQRLPSMPGRRIGIVWSGNPAQAVNSKRSIPVSALHSLTQTENVLWISLQFKAAVSGADEAVAIPGLVDLTHDIQDFADTAAIVSLLDLTITCDTSVAHLAGAMGRPVWVLLSTAADWRWTVRRLQTPWYPSARLFRQQRPGDWAPVVAETRCALAAA
jgi:hypothetical protein